MERRSFLKTVVATCAALFVPRKAWGSAKREDHRYITVDGKMACGLMSATAKNFFSLLHDGEETELCYTWSTKKNHYLMAKTLADALGSERLPPDSASTINDRFFLVGGLFGERAPAVQELRRRGWSIGSEDTKHYLVIK